MNEIVAKTDNPFAKLKSQLDARTIEIDKALPDHIPVERFKRVVMTAVQMNPALLEADRPTLFTSALRAAHDGLLPDGREGALVIYNTKIKINGAEKWIDAVQWMPMIAGLRKKVRNSGEIATWDANVVYERDEFLYETGFETILKHKPYMGVGDPGQVVAAYSVATLKSGEKSIEVMRRFEIDRIRSLSKAKDNPKGPWVMHFSEMAKKTVARRHSKVLPMSTDLDDLIRQDDELYDLESGSDRAVKGNVRRPQLSDFSEVEGSKPTDTKPGAPAEPEKPAEEQAPAVEEVKHDAETGEVQEEPAEPSPADAYKLGEETRKANKPRRVPQEIVAAGESFEAAWEQGWDAADEELAAAKKKR